jgi:hypothetical protein
MQGATTSSDDSRLTMDNKEILHAHNILSYSEIPRNHHDAIFTDYSTIFFLSYRAYLTIASRISGSIHEPTLHMVKSPLMLNEADPPTLVLTEVHKP